MGSYQDDLQRNFKEQFDNNIYVKISEEDAAQGGKILTEDEKAVLGRLFLLRQKSF